LEDSPVRIHIGSDHAGLDFKNVIVKHLQAAGHDVVDHGPHTLDPLDDYPVFCIPAAEAVANEPGSLGIVLGGSGNGEQIAANKVKGIRAALAWSIDTAKLARQHNDANVLSIGGRMHTPEFSLELVDAFIAEPFSNDERHIRRIKMVGNYEIKGSI
jgi:ribose 5-phosphate isomerase B